MAHFGQMENELGKRLQKAVGLGDRDILSIDVSLHLADDEIVTTTVTFIEAIDQVDQDSITQVHEWMAKQEVV